ncbi:endolytic transglycosylase MltG [Candidatus Saccharibacteria bacterium]|nr:endolytic transglycosylase MltG [Candidatus Saccharibacteria bacterium]
MKIIGLDVGTKRIGVARADTSTKIAIPDSVIIVNGREFNEIARIARQLNTAFFVIGLPRSNSGNETTQSAYVRNFAKVLAQSIPGAKIRFQDESLTSVEAESRLKARKKAYQKGEIDAEAAAIILQDFIENFSATTVETRTSATPSVATVAADVPAQKKLKKSRKLSLMKKIGLVVFAFILLFAIGGLVAYSWYDASLRAIYDGPECTTESTDTGCQYVSFSVSENEAVSQIADNLKSAGLIRDALAFKIYVKLGDYGNNLKSGEYILRQAMSVPDIVQALVDGAASTEVFNFTIIPGDTIADIEQKLLKQGYAAEEIAVALNKKYDLPVLRDKPDDVSLEGYLYAETYQFYNGESVENILLRAMDELWKVVEANDLINLYQAQGLNLHQGITLASIVQMEAKTNDQPQVAQVFLRRLRENMALGSDVTVTYAANLAGVNRAEADGNAELLQIDSPYNTRKYAGLPPGAIANPTLSALMAVAHPAEGDYLYFLTGDDGKMYYSHTESEHQQNAQEYCKELCNVLL